MKNITHPLKVLLLVGILTVCFPIRAQATERIQTQQPVTLTVSLTYGEEGISRVPYYLFRVADLSENGTAEVMEAFKPYQISFETPDSNMAETLANAVWRDGLVPDDSGITKEDGTVQFPNEGKTLYPGWYLLFTEPASRDGCRYETAPVLLTLPTSDPSGGSLLYDISVSAKASRVSVPDTDTPDSRTFILKTPQRLPQTGLLWWPVPILALCGLTCLLLVRYFKYRGERNR